MVTFFLKGLLFLQNIRAWMKDKSEVEVVDLVLKLREKLVSWCASLWPVSWQVVARGLCCLGKGRGKGCGTPAVKLWLKGDGLCWYLQLLH